MTVRVIVGDCLAVMAEMPDACFDSAVTDPPYHLTAGKKGGTGEASVNLDSPYGRSRISTGFMSQEWDGGDVAFRPETWAAVLRVLKPGAHLLAFGGTRTFHRLVCAIEDAGFEVRDQLAWVYGSGFPKSLDVSKAIDKAAGAEREVVGKDSNFGKSRLADGKTTFGDYAGEWNITAPATPEAAAWTGWGTALKPAWEPICLARKPLIGTVAANVLRHGTGALNIDGCRIGTDGGTTRSEQAPVAPSGWRTGHEIVSIPLGRWPANLIHDGSDEVLAGFPEAPGQLFTVGPRHGDKSSVNAFGDFGPRDTFNPRGDEGSAARFFYCAKASAEDRGEGNNHPTVKPADLMRWLVRLVTPKGGHVLDPFGGSGSTGLAASREQFSATLIELSPEYAAIARKRLADDLGPLFGGMAAE